MLTTNGIVQAWCNCGAGAVGDSQQSESVALFITAHAMECDKGLVFDEVMKVSYEAPCGERVFGEDTTHAVHLLNEHKSVCADCKTQ